MNSTRKRRSASLLMKASVSIISLSAMSGLVTANVYAQSAAPAAQAAAAPEPDTTVVVVGVRKSLKTSQQLKKNADTVVDSITANDIGAFPDKSVAEALQRVPGITVSRFDKTGDTQHYTGEASGVIVRGLPQVRSEFNGRDTFSANASRGLGWEDVTPELMAGVDTYKNQTADLTEGGIAGTINLRTRLPFDQKGQHFAFSADESYVDLAKKWSPNASALYTNRWDTSIGEFGLMANIAGSEVVTTSQGAELGQYNIYAPGFYPGTTTNTYIPGFAEARQHTYTRDRTGVALAGQWKSPDGNTLATLQYNRSDYKSKMQELYQQEHISNNPNTNGGRGAITTADVTSGTVGRDNTAIDSGTTFKFASDGFFISGSPISGSGDCGNTAPGNYPAGQGPVVNDQGQAFFKCPTNGLVANQIVDGGRITNNNNYTQDLSLNVQWQVSDKLKTNFDLQYVDAQLHEYDMTAILMSWANSSLDLSGKYPKMVFDQMNQPVGFNLSAGGVKNRNNWTPFALMDHTEDDNGHEVAGKFDAEYEFGTPWLNSIKAGVRYADREQTVRWSTYNFQFAEFPFNAGCRPTGPDYANPSWGGPQTHCYTAEDNFHLDKAPWPSAFTSVQSLHSDILDGGLTNVPTAVFPNLEFLADKSLVRSQLAASTTKAGAFFGGFFNPICSNKGARAGEIDSESEGCYLPKEIQKIGEKTEAAYALVKFGGSDAVLIDNITVSGNFGVRVVHTTINSDGYFNFPTGQDLSAVTCIAGDTTQGNLQNCDLKNNHASDFAFQNGAGKALTAKSSFNNVLPSFNIKLNLTDKIITRFAYSKAMSRPDIGLMRNFTTINAGLFQNGNSVYYKYTGSSGNPYLKPTTADNYDLTFENYFASVGSFTADLFYKKFDNYVTTGSYGASVTNNGVTEPVLLSGPVNGTGASITGLEVAYQRFFDFLPAPWDGLGIQANYTQLHNTGITNGHVSPNSAGDATGVSANNVGYDPSTFINPKALEGVSDKNYNLVGMYEKGPWALRVAYNWRSEYLLTSADCCSIYPVWQKAIGFLDASARYKLSDQIELSVQGTNLLNSKMNRSGFTGGPNSIVG